MSTWRVAAIFLGAFVPAQAVAGSHGHNTPPAIRLTIHIGDYSQPAISGDIVVWFDDRWWNPHARAPGVDIYGRSLHSSRGFRITSSPTADAAGSLMVSGPTVLWDDCRHCRTVNGLPG